MSITYRTVTPPPTAGYRVDPQPPWYERPYAKLLMSREGHRDNTDIGRHKNCIPIAHYATDGTFLRAYGSVREAAEELGIASCSIYHAIYHERKLAGGYWKKLPRQKVIN